MQSDSIATGILSLLVYGVMAVVLVGYFVPFIVALKRNVNVGPVFVINLFLGWSLIGWVVALALACMNRTSPTVVVQQVLPTTQFLDPSTIAAAAQELSPPAHHSGSVQDVSVPTHQGF